MAVFTTTALYTGYGKHFPLPLLFLLCRRNEVTLDFGTSPDSLYFEC